MRRALLIVLAASALSIVPAASARHVALAATARDRRLVSVKNGISVEAPTGWTLSMHTGYPNIVVLLLHPDGSRISIAADETQAKDASALVELSRRSLEEQAVTIVKIGPGARDGVEIQGQYAASGEGIVQLYIVRRFASDGPMQAIVITLVAPRDSLANQRAALDLVIARLGLNPPPPVAAPTTTRPTSTGERPAEKQRR
jgi:hypothetical protein